MSRSKKDGRGRGGHKQHRGDDYWSRRLRGMPSRTTANKRLTHAKERAAAKRELLAASRPTEKPE